MRNLVFVIYNILIHIVICITQCQFRYTPTQWTTTIFIERIRRKNLFPIDDGVINARTTYVVCLCSIERSRCDRIDHELLAFLASESVSLLFFSSFYDGMKTFRRSAVVRVVAKF